MKKMKKLLFLCFAMMAACMLKNTEAQAEKVGKYEMSDTSSCSNYDVTGDGVPDTVNFEKLDADENDMYQAFKVIVNGNTVLYEYNQRFYDIIPVFMQTKDHGYFFISLTSENDDGTKKIYKYEDGCLKEVADLDDYVMKLYYHSSATVSSVKSNTITLKVVGQTNMLAYTDMSFVYKVGKNGKLSLKNKVVKLSYTNFRYSEKKGGYKSKYLVAKKKIQVYRNATGAQKAFSIKKGTKLKITKVCVKGKKPRYYCVTKSGKKGWVKSKFGLFKDTPYAG